jgi:hypothetical protein
MPKLVWKTPFGKSLIFIPLQKAIFRGVEKSDSSLNMHLFPPEVRLCFGKWWGRKWKER